MMFVLFEGLEDAHRVSFDFAPHVETINMTTTTTLHVWI